MQRHGVVRDIFQTERMVDLPLLYYMNIRKARRQSLLRCVRGVRKNDFINEHIPLKVRCRL